MEDRAEVITADTQNYDIGLIYVSSECFDREKVYRELYDLKKLVYLFGKTPLQEVQRAVILMSRGEYMEAISSTSFYISETLGLELCLCFFDPEGDFQSGQKTVNHFETLSHIFHYPIRIEERQANPVRALKEMHRVLQITPFDWQLKRKWRIPYFSTKVEDYLLEEIPHPKLLVPVEM